MALCPACGGESDPAERFCGECGRQLSRARVTKELSGVPPSGVPAPMRALVVAAIVEMLVLGGVVAAHFLGFVGFWVIIAVAAVSSAMVGVVVVVVHRKTGAGGSYWTADEHDPFRGID